MNHLGDAATRNDRDIECQAELDTRRLSSIMKARSLFWLYCPMIKEACVGSRCVKWFGCLRSRYTDFYFMRSEDQICPKEHYLIVMNGKEEKNGR